MHAILLLILSVLITNSNCFSSEPPEIEEPNTEQVRQIAISMLAFREEILESTTASLKTDKVLYEFFGQKKGKKYRVLKGKCTLGRLKSFSSRLQDDIEEMTNDKDGLANICNQFSTRAIAKEKFDEALEFYGISSREKVASRIDYFESHLTKLTAVKSHVDALVDVITPQSMTLKKSWEYFESHIEEYLPSMSVPEIARLKPLFLVYVHDYYGLD